MTETHAERRRAARRQHVEDHGILAAFIRPGRRITIVNASATGALIESGHRLLPGAIVECQIQGRPGRTAVRARIVRSYVALVRCGSLCYRAALQFDQRLPWLSEAAPGGYRVPSTDPLVAREGTASATRYEA